MILKSISNFNENNLKEFTSGNKDLDRFLKKYALENDLNGYGKTFLLIDENEVVGFFTLCSASIKFEEYPLNSSISIPKYPIPCIRIARLAVRKDKQGCGYGKELLKQAFIKILSVSLTIGIKLIVVDAKETSAAFYEKYGFTRLINDKLSYFLPLDTLKEAIK